jgi:mannose-6-phosphate isomerase-like protein (cupin superfamily)
MILVSSMWNVIESDKIPFSPYPKGTANIKRIAEQKTVGCKRFTGFGLLEIPPGGVFPEHTHPDREEIYYVLSGSGTIIVEDKEISAKEGLAVYVSGEHPHGIRNQTDKPLTVLFVHVQI